MLSCWLCAVCALLPLVAAQNLSEPEVLYRMGDVLVSMDDPTSHAPPMLLPAVQNDTLCGVKNATVDASGLPQGCALRYAWSRDQLRTVLTAGAERDSMGIYHTGRMYESREPMAGDVEGRELAWSISGDRGLVMDLWWRGPGTRLTSFTLWTWMPTSWPHTNFGGFLSPVGVLRAGLWTNGRFYVSSKQFGVSGGWAKAKHTPYTFRGPVMDSDVFGRGGFLGKWHHLVVSVNPSHAFNGSIKVWNDGFSGVYTCQTWGFFLPPVPSGVVANESGLPAAASTACDAGNMTLVETEWPSTVQTPMPRNASYATLRFGLNSWFNFPGVLDSGEGGVSSSLGIFTTDSPFTLGHRLTAADRAPAETLRHLPPVSRASLSCGRSAETSNHAGRVVCTARCVSPDHVPRVHLRRLCDELGASEELEGLCDLIAAARSVGEGEGAANGTRRWRDWSVWSSEDDMLATWLPFTYPTPSGMSHLLGAVQGANESVMGLNRRDAASLTAWAEGAPWSNILQTFPGNATREATPASDDQAQSATGSMLECGSASPLVERYRDLSSTMAVEMCLGGLSGMPGLGDANSVINTDTLNQIGLSMRESLVSLSGLPSDESWRVTVMTDGYVTAETALAMAEATGTAAGWESVESLCQHPTRDSFKHAYGPDNVSSCVCMHVVYLPRHSPGLVAAGRAPPEAVAASAAHLASTVGLSLSALPRHTTSLTPLVSVSDGSVRLLPVYRCASRASRLQSINRLPASDATKTALLSVLSDLDGAYQDQYGASAAGLRGSLAPCDGTEEDSLLVVASGGMVAVLVYCGLVLWYVCSHGSMMLSTVETQSLLTERSDHSGTAGGAERGLLPRGLRRARPSSPDSSCDVDSLAPGRRRTSSTSSNGEPDPDESRPSDRCQLVCQTCLLCAALPVVTLCWGSCARALQCACLRRAKFVQAVGPDAGGIEDAADVTMSGPAGDGAAVRLTNASAGGKRTHLPAAVSDAALAIAESEDSSGTRDLGSAHGGTGGAGGGSAAAHSGQTDTASASGVTKRRRIRASPAFPRRAVVMAQVDDAADGTNDRSIDEGDRYGEDEVVHVYIAGDSSRGESTGSSRNCAPGSAETHDADGGSSEGANTDLGSMKRPDAGETDTGVLAAGAFESGIHSVDIGHFPPKSGAGHRVGVGNRGNGGVSAGRGSMRGEDARLAHHDGHSAESFDSGLDEIVGDETLTGAPVGPAANSVLSTGEQACERSRECVRRSCSLEDGDRYLAPAHIHAVDTVVSAPSVGMFVAGAVAVVSIEAFVEPWVAAAVTTLLVYPVALRLCVGSSELLSLDRFCVRVGRVCGAGWVCEGCGSREAAPDALGVDTTLGWAGPESGGELGASRALQRSQRQRRGGRPTRPAGMAEPSWTAGGSLQQGGLAPSGAVDSSAGVLVGGGTETERGGREGGGGRGSASAGVSVCFGCRVVSSLAAEGGGVLGRKFALFRLLHPASMAVIASLSLFDVRAMRMVFAGLCEPQRPRLGSLGSRLAGRSRVSLGRVECVCVAPALMLLAAGLLVCLWMSDDAVCQSLSDRAVMELVDRHVPCEEEWLCSHVGCTLTAEGWWRVGLPVLHGVVWLLCGAWERMTSCRV